MELGKRHRAIAVYCCAALLALAGCASPVVDRSAESPQGFAAIPSIGNDTAPVTNLAGRYHGKFFLKNKHIGSISFDLTQSGTAAGGSLTLALSKQPLREPVALTLDTAKNSFTGSAVDPTGKTACAYALRGSYDPKTFILRGTSSPLTCPGKIATFTTTESCFYNTDSSTSVRRPSARGIIEC